MRIAYFSPLPPKRTGIATYGTHLARALGARVELDFFDAGAAEVPIEGAALIDYVARPETLQRLPDYDRTLYHLGNNPHFHLDIYRAFISHPGVVVLHDTALYYLFAGLSRGGMLREFLYNFGADRLSEFFAIERDSPFGDVLRYREPERYPFLRRVLDRAQGIIVHSRTTADAVLAAGYRGSLEVIPHLAYPSLAEPLDAATRLQLRTELGVAEGEILIGCFGFIGPPKRLPAVFDALARLKTRIPYKLLVVGEGEDPKPDIDRFGLADRTILPGFVDDGKFERLLKATDLLVNLRFPSMGEASGPLTQAMACGMPAIISNHAWFAELPDEAVRKVDVGAAEAAELEQALLELGQDSARRRQLGEAAQAYSRQYCAPEAVAARYLDFLEALPPPDLQAGPESNAPEFSWGNAAAPDWMAAPSEEEEWLQSYFTRRVQQAIGA